MTATFWTVAALFCGVAILILLVPMWRHRKRGGRWSLPGVVASVLIAPLAIALYFYVSNWDAGARGAREPRDRVARAARAAISRATRTMSRAGGCSRASYMQLGRYAEGRAAYQRLWALTPRARRRAQARVRRGADSRRSREPHAARQGGSSRKCSRRNPDESESALVRRARRARARPRRRGSSALDEAARAEPARGRRASRARLSSRRSAATALGRRAARGRAGRARDQAQRHARSRAVAGRARTRGAALHHRARGRRRAADRRDPAAAERGAGRVLVERREQHDPGPLALRVSARSRSSRGSRVRANRRRSPAIGRPRQSFARATPATVALVIDQVVQ